LLTVDGMAGSPRVHMVAASPEDIPAAVTTAVRTETASPDTASPG
jgi:hypothetical protein